jgi:hypothetical protein
MQRNVQIAAQLEREAPGSLTTLTRDYGVRIPGRYPIELLKEQAKAEVSPGQSYGFAVSAVTDHNGAFDGGVRYHQLYDAAKQNGSTLRVAEAGSRAEILARASDMLERNHGKKAEFMLLAGHGSGTTIEMGAGKEGMVDATVLGIGPDRSSVVLDGPVLLDSCLSGVPGGVAQIMSQVTDKTVTAPDRSAYIKKVGLIRDSTTGKLSFAVDYDGAKAVHTRTYAHGVEVNPDGSAIPQVSYTPPTKK